MKEETKRLLKEIATERTGRHPEIRALAGAVLELADSDRPAIPLTNGSRQATSPLRDQMKAVLVHEDMTPSAAERVLDELFDVLEQDPGHDVTSYVLAAGQDRPTLVGEFQMLIRAIRRGE